MENVICKNENCTACGLCKYVCPVKCVYEDHNIYGDLVYKKDLNRCINCHLCENKCPNNTQVELNYPQNAYVAWSNDKYDKRNGASGGIATSLYRFALRNNYVICGVKMDSDFNAFFRCTFHEEDIKDFQRSKYTFSSLNNIFGNICSYLEEGKNVLFIGMPCQNAAVKSLLNGKRYHGELLLVDLACHGMPPGDYLLEHIHTIEGKAKRTAQRCEFRDPAYGTNNYYFTLYECEGNKPFYSKSVVDNDVYQIGYHKALIYRENCYSCQYSQRMRCGDLTLSDYNGLGTKADYRGNKKDISCLLVNTNKGKDFLNKVQEENIIYTSERPLEEPLEADKQFNQPSKAPKERMLFIDLILNNHSFDDAAKIAFSSYVKTNNRKKWLVPVTKLKDFILSFIPRKIKNKIKNLI